MQIQGAKSAVMTAAKRSDRISQWLLQLKERVGWQKAVVACELDNRGVLGARRTNGVLLRGSHLGPRHPNPDDCAFRRT